MLKIFYTCKWTFLLSKKKKIVEKNMFGWLIESINNTTRYIWNRILIVPKKQNKTRKSLVIVVFGLNYFYLNQVSEQTQKKKLRNKKSQELVEKEMDNIKLAYQKHNEEDE